MLDTKIKDKESVDKSDISEFINDIDLNEKIETIPTKGELKAQQDEIIKL